MAHGEIQTSQSAEAAGAAAVVLEAVVRCTEIDINGHVNNANQVSAEEALQNAARLFQDGGAAAVKLEGGRSLAATVRRLTDAGLPVIGHIGLTPQHVHRLGGMWRQARDDEAAQTLVGDALELEDAGAIAIVLEAIPDAVAEDVTRRLTIPTMRICS
jgi:3-methyl-2-oxobutanoate hydroxymethyltransferase